MVTDVLLEVVQAMGFEHGVEDLRHRLLLEDPPVGAQPGAGQDRFNRGAVAGAAKAGVALADLAVNVVNRLTAFQTLNCEMCAVLRSCLFHELVEIDVGERKSWIVELTQNVKVRIQFKTSKVIQCRTSTHDERRFESVHFIGFKWAVLLYGAFKQQFAVGVFVVEVFWFPRTKE